MVQNGHSTHLQGVRVAELGEVEQDGDGNGDDRVLAGHGCAERENSGRSILAIQQQSEPGKDVLQGTTGHV